MSKQFSLGIFLANWILGLFLILLLPAPVGSDLSFDGKSHLQTSKSVFSESFNLPETASYDIESEPFAVTLGIKRLIWHSVPQVVEILFSEYTTVPFFDILKTFIHFFFTW